MLLHSHSKEPTGLPFKIVADALNASEQYPSLNSDKKTALVSALLDQALASRPDNPVIEVFALLRILLPQMDNRSVYGFKTTGLIKSFAKAMEKNGGLSGKAAASQLLEWIKEPKPFENGHGLVTLPEVAIARANSRCFPDTPQQAPLSIMDIAIICQRLTNTYKERHKQKVITLVDPRNNDLSMMSVHVDSVAEVLAGVLPLLSYVECKLLVKLLLRTVPIGIGPQTVLNGLGPSLSNFLKFQLDLGRLALSAVMHPDTPGTLVCGVPFSPMTCNVTSSPYLMKWLFSKEDTVQTYIAPKLGRLVIHSSGAWFVPLKGSSSAMRNRFVDLESSAAVAIKARQRHMYIMRAIKRSGALINDKNAHGYLISYMLYEENGLYVLLLNGVKTLSTVIKSIEFVDASVGLDDPSKSNSKEQTVASLIQSLIKRSEPFTLTVENKALNNVNVMVTSHYDYPDPARKNDKKVVNATTKGMIVQRKMDGDRMQAHILMGANGKPEVRLFTKKGRPVQTLYSDVAQELEHAMLHDQPCILDGEIIVVNSEGNPLPWCSTKWRYNSSATPQKGTPGQVVTLVKSAAYGYNPVDGEGELTFAPHVSALMAWTELGASERDRLKARAILQDDKASLLFVIFDILMFRGRDTANLPYSERLSQLRQVHSLARLKHSKVITETWFVQNTEQLIEKMGYIVQQKGEGLVLKDPRAKYEFTRSLHQRKLKISGPDINCGVVGIGFTHSHNPRMWGLLTVVHGSSSSSSSLWVYNRIESLEGDKIKTAAEHVLSLSSLVSLDQVLQHTTREKAIQRGAYSIYSTKTHQTAFTVTWERSGATCTVHFLQGRPKDVQWLCDPFECKFGISQRGDMYPVDWRAKVEDAQDEVVVPVPRFPVGRIQLDDHQRSEFDSVASIEAKFRQAADEMTCIQDFFQRRIKQLRTKPPDARKLEEIRRILMGRENPKESWPQTISMMYRLDEFSNLLKKNNFDELNAGERMVLAGMPTASQWDTFFVNQVPIPPSIEEENMQASLEAETPTLLRRLKELKAKIRLDPVLLPSTTCKKTGFNFLISSTQSLQLLSESGPLPPSQGSTLDCFAAVEEEADVEEEEEEEEPLEYHDIEPHALINQEEEYDGMMGYYSEQDGDMYFDDVQSHGYY